MPATIDMNARTVTRTLLGVCIALACGTAASAHHSNAMYDFAKSVTLRGVVTEFRWTNPYVTITIMTNSAAGEEGDLWILESTSPGNLARVGWTRTSVKTNDRVEILVSPLRDGGHGGRCRRLTFLDRKDMLEC